MGHSFQRFCILFGLFSGSIFGQTQAGDWAVLLTEAPLGARAGGRAAWRSAEVRTQLRGIQNRQRTLRGALERRGMRVTGAAQTLVNALFVRATAQQAREIRALPGVARVAWLPPVRMLMDRAATLVRAPAAWEALGGTDNAGLGVRIGIIDSGLDDLHPGLQDPGLAAPENLPQVLPQDLPYTSPKVIVARSYVGALPNQPDDPTPLDHVGHGTAMAMVAAGVPNTGPAGSITGIAPKAWLGNYKIFGSPGTNDTSTIGVVIQALEDALADGMDVVTLAVGYEPLYPPFSEDAAVCAGPTEFPLGIPSDSCDVLAQAVERAVAAGMTVVAAVGDDGQLSAIRPVTYGTVNSPANVPAVISVGASLDAFSSVLVPGDAVPPELRRLRALMGDGARPSEAVTAPLADVTASGDDGLACGPLPDGSLTGAIALVERGDCAFYDKVYYAAQAGALGVLLYNSDGDDLAVNPLGLAGVPTPTMMIGNADGVALKAYLATNPGATVTLDPAITAPGGPGEEVAAFSSRGPALGSDPGNAGLPHPQLKPELVAPGQDIYTATQVYDYYSNLWDRNGYTFVRGSSFSAGMVAGAAALVKQRNPGLTPAQIKSAVVNTAAPELTEAGAAARVTSVGAGKLNVAAAVAATAAVEPATLSFGAIRQASLPISATLKITNTGTEAAVFNLALAGQDADENAKIGLNPATLELNPGDSGTVTVQLEGTQPLAGSYQGVITVEGGTTALRVPYLYLVSDGQVADLFPIVNGAFYGYRGDTDWMIVFRALDQFGIPLADVPVAFSAVSGGGAIACSLPEGCADATTDKTGKAAALVTLGPRPGEQVFAAEAGGLKVYFYAYAQ